MSIFTNTWLNDRLRDLYPELDQEPKTTPEDQTCEDIDPRTVIIDIEAEVTEVRRYRLDGSLVEP
jgi:hypothetical protein